MMLTIFLLVGCTTNKQQYISNEPPKVERDTVEISNVELEVIADKLATPWSIEHNDNTFYLSERPGNIVKIAQGEIERQRVILKKSCYIFRSRFTRICSCS